RYRDDSDLNRVKRQQVVLEGAVEKVFERGLLSNLADATALWDAYKATVHTDIAKSEILGLANLLRETQGNMVGYSLGDPVNGRPTLWGMTTDDGASVLDWDPVNVQAIIAQAFSGGKYGDSLVEIQNGTGSAAQGEQLARGLGRYLQINKALPAVELGLDVVQQPTTTIVLYTENRRPMANDIARWLNLPETAVKTQPKPSDSTPDIVIIIGKDFKIPGT
ncbi:MAG: LytR C-terminal domain-containing protein, partial [Thermomicrobiales bacterium]